MSNIRFRVHRVPHYSEILENEWYSQSENIENTFFTLMNMINVLEPILDPIQIAIRIVKMIFNYIEMII